MLPVARAWPSLFSVTSTGKFHGTIAPTTPTGSFHTCRVLDVPRRSTASGRSVRQSNSSISLIGYRKRAVERDVELIGVRREAGAPDFEDQLLAELLAL